MHSLLRPFDTPRLDLNDKAILLTGGTGSFGHAFVRRIIAEYQPRRLIIFSRDELKQYEMQQVFPDTRYPFLRYFIGDVRDQPRLETAMRGVDYVVHAAALKHVPIAEYNPIECVKTNIYGAENVVQASIRSGVQKVVALSTDKACNPANLYGATKLASDKIFVAGNSLAGGLNTRFAVVRYGNVLGSRGSVVPFFRRLLADGATRLPITDPRMTRFWIRIEQGVDFVLSTLAMMEGGELYVPKIPSVSVTDLAKALAPEAELDIVGIRPGEKLHEVMIGEDDCRNTLELDDRYVIEPLFDFWSRSKYELVGAKPVPEGFIYSSNTNTEWLSGDDLRAVLETV